MKDKLAKLINVKSIITLLLTVLFIVSALLGRITGEQLLNIYTVIIAFYFGTQVSKSDAETTTASIADTANTDTTES